MERIQSLFLGACCALLISISPAAMSAPQKGSPGDKVAGEEKKAPVEPMTLPGEASEALRGFLAEVEGLLLKSVTGKGKAKSEARSRLREMAIVPTYFDEELDTFVTTLEEAGRAKKVRLTSVEVNATLWYGMLPVRDVKLVFWTSGEGLRLLRLARFDLPMEPFTRKTPNSWSGPVPSSFGALSEAVLREATDGDCARLPAVTKADYKAVLPKDKERAKQTLSYLEKFRFKIATTCAGIQGTPWHSMTWSLGEMGGVVTNRDGSRLTFKTELVQGPKRQVRLYKLRRPTPPRKTTEDAPSNESASPKP